MINCRDLLNVYLDSSTRVNDEPGNTTLESLQKSMVICDKRNIQDLLTGGREGGREGGRDGNCIVIPASLKLGVTMARSKTQIPGISFSNFINQNLDHRKSEIFKQPTFFRCKPKKYFIKLFSCFW